MFESLTWILIGLGVAIGLSKLHYYGWVFGVREKLGDVRRIRMHTTMARLRGRHGERHPAEDVEQALNDVLNGAPALGGEPDDDLWIPEVRRPGSRQPDRRAIQP